jgi:hypothetical protein
VQSLDDLEQDEFGQQLVDQIERVRHPFSVMTLASAPANFYELAVAW